VIVAGSDAVMWRVSRRPLSRSFRFTLSGRSSIETVGGVFTTTGLVVVVVGRVVVVLLVVEVVGTVVVVELVVELVLVVVGRVVLVVVEVDDEVE
jgi:hypothetical protein